MSETEASSETVIPAQPGWRLAVYDGAEEFWYYPILAWRVITGKSEYGWTEDVQPVVIGGLVQEDIVYFVAPDGLYHNGSADSKRTDVAGALADAAQTLRRREERKQRQAAKLKRET